MNSWNRVDAFEHAQETTAHILSQPAIIDSLGEHAQRLSKTVEGLFLPVIDNGVGSLPAGQLLSNEFALLPHANSELERGVTLDGSFLTPTGNRLQEAAQSFSERQGRSIDSATRAARLLVRSVARSRNSVHVALGDSKGAMHTWLVTDADNGLAYRTRPILHTSIRRVQTTNPYQLAGTVCHEIIHGEDHENAPSQKEYDTAFHAGSELRAYHVGAVIRAAGGVLEGDGKTQEVEALRLQHTDPNAPFEPTVGLIARMQELGVIG